ncbi:MAG: TGS domain-containing protein [Anaerolineae bacterium]|jgi:ribosome-interacting GTPase 1
MPTNLPPEYFEVEKRYRAASSTAEKIATLEELISTIPKHKGTDKLRANFRKRLSKLKSATQGKKGVSKQESVYHIDKEGEGQLAVIGPTNVGKSALVAALTNATPEVAEAPFTTWQPTPGMMPIENVQVQLIDTPPLNRDFVEPQLLDLIRRADIMLLVVDLQADPFQQLEDTIALLEEHRIAPLHLKARYTEGRPPTFVPLLVLVNKHDDESLDEDLEIFLELLEGEWPLLPISAATGRNLEGLKQTVYQQLDIMRVYSKPPGKEPDLSAPFVLERGSSVEEFARKVHQDFFEQLKTARVWGSSATFDGQMVGREHVLQDGDVVELRL